jgi:S-adenosylmethionine hydrolase
MARSFTRLITTPAAARMSRDWNRPFVSLISDFGSRDPSPAICRGVVLGIAPDALIVDISHDVDKFQVRDGALLLWCALPYLPVGSHVAVIDPGVGTERRGIAIETGRGDMLVGPDNGLLLPGAERLGGIVRVHELLNGQYRLPVVSSSFHGRDLFAPAAAHLALGVPLEMMGPPVDPRDLETLDWPQSEVRDGELVASIVYLDTFGNVKLAALAPELTLALGHMPEGQPLAVRIGSGRRPRQEIVTYAQTFGHVPIGEPLLYEDSYGRLCIAVNQGSAVERLGLREGQELTITLTEPVTPARMAPASLPEAVVAPPPSAFPAAPASRAPSRHLPADSGVPATIEASALPEAPGTTAASEAPTVAVPVDVARVEAIPIGTEPIEAILEAPPTEPSDALEPAPEPTAEPAVPSVSHIPDEEAWEAWAAEPTDGSRMGSGVPAGADVPARSRPVPEPIAAATRRGSEPGGEEPTSEDELWRAWQLPDPGKR